MCIIYMELKIQFIHVFKVPGMTRHQLKTSSVFTVSGGGSKGHGHHGNTDRRIILMQGSAMSSAGLFSCFCIQSMNQSALLGSIQEGSDLCLGLNDERDHLWISTLIHERTAQTARGGMRF